MSGVVFPDLKKTFHFVDHDILLNKFTIYLKTLPFLKLYLDNRMQCVLLLSSYSSEYAGVWCTKSSVLGPILFSHFINDLQLHVQNISVDCDMLADDTILHTSGKDIRRSETIRKTV